MIQLIDTTVEKETLEKLALYQSEINGLTSYPDQVSEARRLWPQKSQYAPFRDVKAKLRAMCSGANRCCYCEDSNADEVEHMFPKSIYPGKTFVWENYLYSCGSCNRSKSNQFSVFHIDTGVIVKMERTPGEIPEPPQAGQPLLINPRTENPLKFLWLDIIDTFRFTELEDDISSTNYKRARYMISLLKLNQRDELAVARKEAYGDYCARLKEYISGRDSDTPDQELEKMRVGILSKQHPTVWYEMKRQRNGIPYLKTLFASAPEALDW